MRIFVFCVCVLLFVPAIGAQDRTKPREDRRYAFEVVYVLHDRLTSANLKRLEQMFFKAWPKYSPNKNEGKDTLALWENGEDKKYWDSYRARLVRTMEIDIDEVRKRVAKQLGAGEGAAAGQRKTDELVEGICFELCKDRIRHELRLRRMMRFINGDAFAHPDRSLSVVFHRLATHDSKTDPLCSTSAGKGLIVFRHFEKARSREQMLEVRDGEVVFGENLAFRVQMIARKPVPVVGALAYVIGDEGNGRMLLRVSAVEPKPSD